MTGFELMHVSNMACSLVLFLLNVVLNVAAWLIVLTTVDRFVAVWLPLHAAAVCSRRRARLAVLALFIIVAVSSVHMFWTTGLYHPSGRKLPMCGPSPDAHFLRHEFEYIKLTSYSLAPFVIILILNIAIVVRLHCGKAANILLRSSSSHSSGVQQVAITSKVTYMLLAVSATWLVLSAPFALHSLLVSVLVDSRNIRSIARYRLVRTVCFQLMYANHAVNFFLYCITGRKFRRELMDMFLELCCKCQCCHRCGCDKYCVNGGHGATRDGDNMMEQGGAPDVISSTTRRGRNGHEMAVITTFRSTRGSVLAVQSTGRVADTSL